MAMLSISVEMRFVVNTASFVVSAWCVLRSATLIPAVIQMLNMYNRFIKKSYANHEFIKNDLREITWYFHDSHAQRDSCQLSEYPS